MRGYTLLDAYGAVERENAKTDLLNLGAKNNNYCYQTILVSLDRLLMAHRLPFLVRTSLYFHYYNQPVQTCCHYFLQIIS